MAEGIIRQHKRRVDRWMPRERKRILTTMQIRQAARLALAALPGFLLSFAEVLGMPSGLHAALGAAQAAAGMSVLPTVIGGAAGLILNLLSGITPHWVLLLSLLLLLPLQRLLREAGTAMLLGCTASAMLPVVIVACLAPTAADLIRGWGAAVIAVLSAPMLFRALNILPTDRHFSSLEELIAVGYLAAMCICGGARMVLLGLNLGVLLAAGAVLATSMVLGAGAGVLTGFLFGMTLRLQGLPLELTIALAMGGFLSGIAASLSRRWVTCAFFALGASLPLMLSITRHGDLVASLLAASLALALLPREPYERLQQFLRRFLQNDPAPGDAYAASALAGWEHTVAALALAVPSPKDAAQNRDGPWWESHLCQGCPEYEQCGCLQTGTGVRKAEQVWDFRHAQEDIWHDALEGLRGMGCQRLYYLQGAMSDLRREDEAARQAIRKAEAQREMLVTHLHAIAGAARRFAALSGGENCWDHMMAKRIRKIIAERAVPVRLTYVRRVQGHVQAAFELQMITGARRQAEELCMLVEAVADVPMCLSALDGDRLLLTERPLLEAEVGMAAEAKSGKEICGDTAWFGPLQDGRYLVALSDGMGHGEAAAMASRQTVELLRLCLDAGYSRQQTLTAVNGMLLLGGCGERFATADMLTIDMWKGHAALDKLGAAASWLYQQGQLICLTGDALPLGILEEIDEHGCDMRLGEGDALILMTDGVEDALGSVSAIEAAVQAALAHPDAQAAAEQLVQAALDADEERRDDQSAVVVYIRRSQGHSGFTLQ